MVFLFRVLKEIVKGFPFCKKCGQVSCQIFVFFFFEYLMRKSTKENILQRKKPRNKPKKKAAMLEPKISLMGV
nr:hypothetical protein [Campylobacter jejuni]